jgi:hypothetical protein
VSPRGVGLLRVMQESGFESFVCNDEGSLVSLSGDELSADVFFVRRGSIL